MGYVYDQQKHGWQKPPRRKGAPPRFCNPEGARQGQYRVSDGGATWLGNAYDDLQSWRDGGVRSSKAPSTLREVDAFLKDAQEVLDECNELLDAGLENTHMKSWFKRDPENCTHHIQGIRDWAKMQRKILRQLRKKLEP